MDKMDIVKDAQEEARKVIVTFMIEIILMILAIFLTLYWFGWKLLVILFVWHVHNTVSDRTGYRGK